jgi:hypothetical protein
MEQTIYIVGASSHQSTLIERLRLRHPEIRFILVTGINGIKNADVAKQIENPFNDNAIRLLKCYEVIDDSREFNFKNEIRETKKQNENRARFHSRINKYKFK